jgi:hypothetical protein
MKHLEVDGKAHFPLTVFPRHLALWVCGCHVPDMPGLPAYLAAYRYRGSPCFRAVFVDPLIPSREGV